MTDGIDAVERRHSLLAAGWKQEAMFMPRGRPLSSQIGTGHGRDGRGSNKRGSPACHGGRGDLRGSQRKG